jgi:branched-chain amino acid transport system substrate-binding protein
MTWKPVRVTAVVLALLLLASACSGASGSAGPPEPLRVGAIYPLSGSQGPGGIEEYRGVEMAARLANQAGGVAGRPVELVPQDVPEADAAPAAVQRLASQGIGVIFGSYGSTISEPAAQTASRGGQVFWETGAVGELMGLPSGGDRVFRVAPAGSLLGKTAMDFTASELLPRLNRRASGLRYTVAAVDDQFGDGVARGAVAELRARGLTVAGDLRYDPRRDPAAGVVRRIATTRPDVLFVVAYIDDGVAIRKQIVAQNLHLVANIGTSSSYCMPAFGAALGKDAVGLFASDKPAADWLSARGLAPDAIALLNRANRAYRAAYGDSMSAAALAGFAGAWALLHFVLPRAGSADPARVAAAARSVDVPIGGLPNGSGLRFGAVGTPDASDNVGAASVIWEWVGVNDRQITWPPRFATAPIKALRITP